VHGPQTLLLGIMQADRATTEFLVHFRAFGLLLRRAGSTFSGAVPCIGANTPSNIHQGRRGRGRIFERAQVGFPVLTVSFPTGQQAFGQPLQTAGRGLHTAQLGKQGLAARDQEQKNATSHKTEGAHRTATRPFGADRDFSIS